MKTAIDFCDTFRISRFSCKLHNAFTWILQFFWPQWEQNIDFPQLFPFRTELFCLSRFSLELHKNSTWILPELFTFHSSTTHVSISEPRNSLWTTIQDSSLTKTCEKITWTLLLELNCYSNGTTSLNLLHLLKVITEQCSRLKGNEDGELNGKFDIGGQFLLVVYQISWVSTVFILTRWERRKKWEETNAIETGNPVKSPDSTYVRFATKNESSIFDTCLK
jgi:hypothetical protein